jgi:hypothetical protein
MTFVGAHDSYAVGWTLNCGFALALQSRHRLINNSAVAADQDRNGRYQSLQLQTWHHLSLVTQQLNDGIRMLQVQTHNKSGAIQLCHTNCVSPIQLLLYDLMAHWASSFSTAESWKTTSNQASSTAIRSWRLILIVPGSQIMDG